MIEALTLAIREAFALVIESIVPLIAVAAVTAVLVGLLGGALGIRDAALAQIVRALAVLLAIGVLVEALAVANVAYAERTWSSLAEDPQ